MKRRRYSLTKEDGEFVILALLHFILDLQEVNETLQHSAYNDYMISRAESLKEKLEEYQWEVET